MKKMLITCGVLCMTLLLFCGTALAKTEVTDGDDASVKVTVSGQEVTVKKDSGVTADQLYLVMIQKGAASEKPTEANLYYLDVDKATGASFEKKAYPKDLEAGEYAVFLSDYSGTNNGARKLVATLTVSADSDEPGTDDPGDSNTGTGTGGDGTVKYGDVNDDKTVDDLDEMVLARYNAGWDDYGPNMKHNMNMTNSDVNRDKAVDDLDEMILSRHNAGWDGYDLPYQK